MLKVEITRKHLAAMGRNAFREIGRNAIYAAAQLWLEKYLPLHFRNIAHLRYGYAQRDWRTNKLKHDRKPWPFGEHLEPAVGDIYPLVFSGRSRESATRTKSIRANAPNYQTYRADVAINAPAFNFGAGKRIDMREEVLRYTPQEEKSMELEFAREFERQMQLRGRTIQQNKRVA